MAQTFHSLAEFYPYYLSEHSNLICRRLHFIGSAIGLMLALSSIWLSAWMLLIALLNGYAFAWVGHFFFEKNRPATFKYPLYSFICDWKMFTDILLGRVKI